MTKQSRKAVKAEVTNEVAKQYKERYGRKIERLESIIGTLVKENKLLRNDNARLDSENIQLTDKLNQYEDWIARLQEWCNLPDDEREKAIKEFKFSQESKHRLDNLMQTFAPYMEMLFR